MDKTAGMILVEGNAAAALGCMFAGVTVVAWYPITPSSSLPETLIGYMKKHRIDKETGKATYAIVQAEDEIASIGMVLGAGWAGARAMTSTSGPGISLMGEFAGLAYYAEVPASCSTSSASGRPRACRRARRRATLLTTAVLSHGDTKQILLIPASVEECYTMAMDAFDLAERFQQPVFVMSDLDLGMNTWMSQPFTYPDQPLDRGKVLDAATLQSSASGAATRTSTATASPIARCRARGMPAFFTRGSGHNEKAQYSERPDDYVHNMERLARKFETARRYVPKPVVDDVAEPGSASSGSAPATGRLKRAAISSNEECGQERPTCACAPIPSPTS